VVGLLVLYILSQGMMQGQPQLLRVLADPFGLTAYLAASRYHSAAELTPAWYP
jgi:hypothetical protein